MNDAVRIARINAGRDLAIKTMDLGIEVLKNPVVELLAGTYIIHLIQKRSMPQGKLTFWESLAQLTATGAMGSTMAAIIMAQQLAPYAPDLIRSSGDFLGTGGKALALLK